MIATPSGQPASERSKLHLDTSAIHIKDIVAATDFSDQATLAVKVAARLAKQLRCKLHVLHAISPQVYASGSFTPVLQQVDLESAREQLHAYAAKITELRTTRHEEVVVCEFATDAISMLAESKAAGLVVAGSSGRGGLNKLILGSVAEATVRRLRCPVLVVGPRCVHRSGSLKQVVFAADLPTCSLRAAQYAMSIARESGAILTIIHVLSRKLAESDRLDMEKKAMEKLRQLVPEDADLAKRIRFEIVPGEPAEEIILLADRIRANLIVMGVQDHGAMADHAPWATMSETIRGARCPVLAVQPRLT